MAIGRHVTVDGSLDFAEMCQSFVIHISELKMSCDLALGASESSWTAFSEGALVI